MTRDSWLATPMCQSGWQPLIDELDTRLRTQWPQYTIDQIKEKFGTLRFYANPGAPMPTSDDDAEHGAWQQDTDAFHAVISEYEAKSGSVCEKCGNPGKLGERHFWYATRCAQCAPQGWVANDNDCTHPTITDDRCETCGRERIAKLEHTDVTLRNVHAAGTCHGEHCTIHNRSDHPLRAYPQSWREDRGIMERTCPHGIGHPDPDEVKLVIHGCDGCCAAGAS